MSSAPRSGPPAEAAPEQPDFGKYQILERIGSGGMGVVFRALDRDLGRTVAIKMLRPRADCPTDVERFQREARTAARLKHPGIVQIHEIGSFEGRPFLAMDYVGGYTLADVLAISRPLGLEKTEPARSDRRIDPADVVTKEMPPDRDSSAGEANLVAVPAQAPMLEPRVTLDILRQAALAIDYAHGQGVIHRDIKPSNILIDAVERRPYLTDFGLAREVLDPERITLSGTILGTPQYMAPEQAGGGDEALGAAADIYSLGAILYEILTGRTPFDGHTAMEVIYRLMHEDPTPPTRLNPRVQRDAETICLKCLEKEPARRYASARDLAEDLGRFLAGEAILARPAGPVARLLRRVGRNKTLTAALVFSALVLAASLASWGHDAIAREREARARLAAGIRLLREKDPQAAVRELSDAAALAREDAEVAHWLQEARRQEGIEHEREIEKARAAALEEQAARRARALPHFLKGEELREKAAVLVQKGDLDTRQGYLKDAGEAYGRALDQDPEFAEAFTGRGRVLAELGDGRRAQEDLARAVALRPEYTEAYLARLMLWTEDYECLWLKGGKVRNADIGTLTELPDVSADPEAQRLQKAIREDIGKVLALGVRPEETQYYQGWLLRISRDLDGAYRAYDESITMWKYFAPGYEGRAMIRLLKGDADTAAIDRDLDTALKLDAGFYRARVVRLFHLLRGKQYLRAAAEVETMIQVRPRLAPMYLARGYIRWRFLGDSNGAFADYREALKWDPASVVAYINLGVLLDDLGKREEALEEFRKGLLVNEKYPLLHYQRALVLVAMKRNEEATTDLDRTLELDPDFAPALVERARVKIERKELVSASEDLARARERDPKYADAFHISANLAYQMGREAEALGFYARAIELEPDEPMFHFNRALVLQRAKRFAEAAAGFERVLALSPAAFLKQAAERRLAETKGALEAAGGK